MAEVYQMEPDKIKEMLPEKSVKGIKEDIAAFENILIKLFYVFVTNAFVFVYFTKEINDSGASVRK